MADYDKDMAKERIQISDDKQKIYEDDKKKSKMTSKKFTKTTKKRETLKDLKLLKAELTEEK
jgi:hypothetical protein